MCCVEPNPVLEFVGMEREKIRSQGLAYSLHMRAIRETFRRQVSHLGLSGLDSLSAKCGAALELAFGLRYLAFMLSDFGRQRLAFWVGFQQNRYRTKYFRFSRKFGWWLLGLVRSSFTGFLTKPFRVLIPVLITLVAFAGLFWLITALGPSPYASVELRGKLSQVSPRFVHYLYLSVATLFRLGNEHVTLGVSTTAPIASFITTTASIVEIIVGYVLLGLAFAVGIRRLGTHPYARLGKWMDDYETKLPRRGPAE
jgi:hypothetical protein